MGPEPNPSFSSTGPHGHRGRMRTRLLANEAALADYELLEMLLFLGIPRRDTKPIAKSLINRFGSLAAALTAPPHALHAADLPPRAAEALALVAESAALLARPETRIRPILGGWDALIRHIDPAARATAPACLGALLLDSRNQLLDEPTWPGDPAPDAVARDMLRRALDRHASAVILLRNRPGVRPSILPADRALHRIVAHAGAPLTVVVHDLVVVGQGRWTSLRQATGT